MLLKSISSKDIEVKFLHDLDTIDTLHKVFVSRSENINVLISKEKLKERERGGLPWGSKDQLDLPIKDSWKVQ